MPEAIGSTHDKHIVDQSFKRSVGRRTEPWLRLQIMEGRHDGGAVKSIVVKVKHNASSVAVHNCSDSNTIFRDKTPQLINNSRCEALYQAHFIASIGSDHRC